MLFLRCSFGVPLSFLCPNAPPKYPQILQTYPQILPKCSPTLSNMGPKVRLFRGTPTKHYSSNLFLPFGSPKGVQNRAKKLPKSQKTTPQNTSNKNIGNTSKKRLKSTNTTSHVGPLFGQKTPLNPARVDLRKTEFGLRPNPGSRGSAGTKKHPKTLFGLPFFCTSKETHKKYKTFPKRVQDGGQKGPNNSQTAIKTRDEKQTGKTT